MSTARLINKYVWFVSTIYSRGPISLAELQNRFEAQYGSDEVLSERTFHRYTDAVEELFDIDIVYDRALKGYVIANREGIDNMAMRKWLLQTFSVNNLINESQDLKNRILLEDIPSGQEFLTPVIEAMREGVALTMTYQSFHRSEASTFEVEPLCIKLFEQRWYMLGRSEKYDKRIYAFDRIKALSLTGRSYKLPKDFDAEKFFANHYGIIVDDEDFDVEPVALKVDAWQSNYLRTLPLHHSQQEVERNEEYSIFEYRLCPSLDFRQKLLSMGEKITVLAPADLLHTILHDSEGIVANCLAVDEEYRFKIYK